MSFFGDGPEFDSPKEDNMSLAGNMKWEQTDTGRWVPVRDIINPKEQEVPMDKVTLSEDFGKHKAGSSFEVIKRSKTTTIVNAGGRRIIVPNEKIDGAVVASTKDSGPAVGDAKDTPKKALVELTPHQDQARVALDEGVDLTEILSEYMSASGLDETQAKADLVFIDDHLEKGSVFKVRPAMGPKVPRPAVAHEMSEQEAHVLAKLLDGGGTWDAEELGVSSDTSEPEEQPELGTNQVWFTDVTNGRLPKSGINHIIQQYDKEHYPESIRVDIPEVDPLHYWDPEVLEALVLAHQLRERACITGLPGTGKTTSVKQFAAWIRQPYMRLGGRGDLEASSFLGYSWADVEEINGEVVSKMSFKPGMLTQGLDTEGFGYLVTIDEVMKIPAYIQMCMQHLYEKDGHLTIDDKPGTKADKIVLPAKEFLLILTDNVKGTGDSFDKFAATQMQDTSSLDRIGINETLDYLDPKDETAMLHKKFDTVDQRTISKLVKFAGLVRNGYRQGNIALTLSPRGLESILEMLAVSIPIARAIELAYSNKIADEAESIAIGDMLKTVGIRTEG